MQRAMSPLSGIAPRSYIRLLLLAAGAIYLFHLYRYGPFVLDDTYISLRYAKNLVDGNGLVFNPGEHVEGYTNFLFVLVAALLLEIGGEPVLALKVIGAVMSFWTLWLVTRLEAFTIESVPGERPLLAAALLAPLPAFAYWSVCPFETIWFTACLSWALYLSLWERRRGRWRGAVFAFVLLALTRPEGAYLFVVCVAVFLALDYLSGSRVRFGRASRDVAIFGVLFGSYFAWRYRYYGSLFPNTFYAKVIGDEGQLAQGLSYLQEWTISFPLLAISLLLVPVLVLRRSRSRLEPASEGLLVVSAVVTAGLAYTAGIGGDFMPFFRFLLPMMPLCCVLSAWLLRRVVAMSKGGVVTAVVLATAWMVHVVAGVRGEQSYRTFVAHRTAVVGKRVGQWLAQQVSANDTIAVNTAGSLPYYSNLPTIDMLGLTDEKIARRPVFVVTPEWAGHRRGWGSYVLSRRPRIILWYNSAGARVPFYLTDRELADDPYFRFFYVARRARLPVANGGSGRPVGWYLGFPFGFDPSGELWMGNLGLEARFREQPVALTTFYEGTVEVNYFELDWRDQPLWELRRSRRKVGKFLANVSERWRTQAPSRVQSDPAVRAEVERMADQAQQLVQAGDHVRARELLSAAVARNHRARSPRVFQYLANLAVITGDLLVAVGAQKEALRLDPANEFYRKNLQTLLEAPYKQPQTADGSDAKGRRGQR
jgi:arabinofuranosyltransferase